MANSPLNENQSENLGSTEPFLNSYASGADSRTVEDISASPNFIKALERRRLIEELDGKRPRFATDEKTAKSEPSELIGVLNGAIAQRSFPKQKIEADQIALAKVHAGRVSLIDASKSFNLSKDTNLSFTLTLNFQYRGALRVRWVFGRRAFLLFQHGVCQCRRDSTSCSIHATVCGVAIGISWSHPGQR